MTPSEPPGVEPRRLHPLSPFFQLLLLGRQFLLPLVLLLFAGRGDAGQFLPLLPVAALTVFGVVRWLRFTYAVDGARFVIDEGVLTRKQRVVPLDRIQQVEVVRRLRHRLLGVAALRVDTAGGSREAEIDLSVISVGEARRLRSLLLRERPVADAAVPATTGAPAGARPSAAAPLVRLDVGQLAIAGMTGSELAVMLTIVFWISQLVGDLPGSFVEDAFGGVSAPSSLLGVAAAAAFLGVVWLALAAAAGIVKNFGFTMTRDGGDLHVRRGLLDQREGSMPLHRLQLVRIQASALRRVLGLVRLVLQSGGGATGGRGLSRIDVPVLGRDVVPALLHDLLPAEPPPASALVAAPPAARRRAIVRRAAPTAAVAAIAVGAVGWSAPLGVAALLSVVVAGVAGEVAYRGLGHAFGGDVLLTRRGGLARELDVVPAARAQSTRLRSTPFQRRAGLATLHVDVAGKGRTPQVQDGDAARLRSLQRAVLLASPAARGDEVEVRHRRNRPDPDAHPSF